MTIGIVGTGKMGLDLFYLLLSYQCDAVLICTDQDKLESIRKKTARVLKRKQKNDGLSPDEIKEDNSPPVISQDYNCLDGCDIIIETVIEKLEIKQQVFQLIENIAKEDCILATNSSSIDITEVFKKVKNKQRCIGVHFFYPLKLTNTVEVNIDCNITPNTIKIISLFLNRIEKKGLILKDDSRLVLSKLLISIAAYSYSLSLEHVLALKDIDTITRNQLMLFGIFEMVDSTGFFIITQCLQNLTDELHKSMYGIFYDKLMCLMKQGYHGRDGTGLLSFADSLETEKNEYSYEEYLLRIQVFLLNEIARYLSADKSLDPYYAGECIKEVLGLAVHPIELYQILGRDLILNILEKEYENTKNNLFKPADFSSYLQN